VAASPAAGVGSEDDPMRELQLDSLLGPGVDNILDIFGGRG
jgi:hypothetical protein